MRLGRRPFRSSVIVAVLLATGCSASTPEVTAPTSVATARQISPEDFAAKVASGERFVVNVHTPDEGGIAGTDVAIPFDELEQRAAELPQDRGAPLAVYCMSGNMSEVAVATLTEMGYADLVELRGGMVAWEQAGLQLVPRGADT